MEIQGLHHPLFQSVILPLLLSLAGIGVLRTAVGPARAGAGVGLAVLLATIWLMGWPPRPASALEKLPWIFAGAWLAGVAVDATIASRLRQWLCLGVGWIAASWWLGASSIGLAIGTAAIGLLVIAWLVQAPSDRADGMAAAVAASLGLAAVCFAAGSLALFQLALLLAAALGGAGLWLWPRPRIRHGATAKASASSASGSGCTAMSSKATCAMASQQAAATATAGAPWRMRGLWLWPRPRIRHGAAAVAVAAACWLAIAQVALLLTAVQPLPLALLALAFAVAPWLARRWRSTPLTSPLAVALAAAMLAGGALLLQTAGPDVSADGVAGSGDPAYYGK